MGSFIRIMKEILSVLTPILPYGVTESWDDLNPRLYLAVHIYWLKIFGMWYNNFSPKNILFWLQLMHGLTVFCYGCIIPGVGEVFYIQKQSDHVGDVAAGLYLWLSEVCTYFKAALFWMNKETIMKILQYLHCPEFKPKEPEHREIVKRSIKRARFTMTLYSTMCIVAVSVGIILPITENFVILPTNVEYPFFDVYQSPAYQIMYILQILYKPTTCTIDASLDTMLPAFVTAAIGQIEIIAFNLRNLNAVAERRRQRAITENKCDGNDSQDYYVRSVLRDCIIHHTSIIRFVSLIESAFWAASALQFMLSVVVLCLVGIQFLTIEEPTKHPVQILWMAIYLTCMLTEVFILCWYGDELMWKSQELREAAFEGPWLNLDKRSKMLIIIFVERCQRPLSLTAGKILLLSLASYTVLMNWAYKAFAVMRNVKK